MALEEFCKLVETLCLYECIKEAMGLVSQYQAKPHVPLEKKFLLLEWTKSGFGGELAMGQGKWGGCSLVCPLCFTFT